MKRNYIFALITILIWASMASMVKLLLANIPNLEALAISSVFVFFIFVDNQYKNRKNQRNETIYSEIVWSDGRTWFSWIIFVLCIVLLRHRRAQFSGGLYLKLPMAYDDCAVFLFDFKGTCHCTEMCGYGVFFPGNCDSVLGKGRNGRRKHYGGHGGISFVGTGSCGGEGYGKDSESGVFDSVFIGTVLGNGIKGKDKGAGVGGTYIDCWWNCAAERV